MLHLQTILEAVNELGTVFVDQHDRTRHLSNRDYKVVLGIEKLNR